MKSCTTAYVVLLVCILATWGCTASEKDQALALIQASGGTINSDNQGRVVSVNLTDSQANDDVLASLRALPEVHTINCTNARDIKGTGLDALAGLQHLETLYLVGTSVDDAGLARLKDLKSLKTLHLGRTNITDAGMGALDSLTNLQTLSLGNTAVTDAGLVQLRDLRKLSTLILRQTKTTPRGVQELRRMLPDTRIDD